jgi:putative oxidoreductase
MANKGIPAAQVLLVGAIAFEVAGGLSILLGYRPRIGAVLLLVFLVLATYYFHDFWKVEDAKERQDQMVHFLKNLAIMGAMVLIIANGTGPMSLDDRMIGTGGRLTGPLIRGSSHGG